MASSITAQQAGGTSSASKLTQQNAGPEDMHFGMRSAPQAPREAHHRREGAEIKGSRGNQTGREYKRWAARGPPLSSGPDRFSVTSQTGALGPGEYPMPSALCHKAAPFTTGTRNARHSEDDGCVYLDLSKSTSLSKRGTVISPSNIARDFFDWDVENVVQWLQRVGLGEMVPRFEREKIRGSHLYDTTNEELRKALRIDVNDRKTLVDLQTLMKQLSILRGNLPREFGLPALGPGRYNSSTEKIYRLTRKRTDVSGVFGKGGPVPVYEDYVLKEATTKPAPNAYTRITEKHQNLMSANISNVTAFSKAAPMTAVERRCKEIEDDPSPGDYDPRPSLKHTKPRTLGGKISTSRRKDAFAREKGDEVPGPGAYDGAAMNLTTIVGRAGEKTLPKLRYKSPCVTIPPKADFNTTISIDPRQNIPRMLELQGIVESIYHSNVFPGAAPVQGKKRERSARRKFSSSSEKSGGNFTLREWHEVLEHHGIVPSHLTQVDAIHVFSKSCKSNLGATKNKVRVTKPPAPERNIRKKAASAQLTF